MNTGVKLIIIINDSRVFELDNHTFHYMQSGTTAAIIQGNVGHISPAMTALYTHISDAAAVEVAKVLDFCNISTRNSPETAIEAQRERLKLLDEPFNKPIDEILESIQGNQNSDK